MLKKYQVRQIDVYDKDRDGNILTYTSKDDGTKKRYKKVRLYVYGEDKPLYGTAWDSNSPMLTWGDGVNITIDVEENNGFLNFKLPKKSDVQKDEIDKRLETLEARVSAIEKHQKLTNPYNTPIPNKQITQKEFEDSLADGIEQQPQESEIQPGDIPF